MLTLIRLLLYLKLLNENVHDFKFRYHIDQFKDVKLISRVVRAVERAVEILLFVENYINTFFHILNSSYALLLSFFL